MVLILGAVLAGLAIGRLIGPRPAHLARLHVRWWAALALGLATQAAANRIDGASGVVLLVASFIMLLAFALANLHLAGMGVLAIGLAMNLAPILLNGGMPVRGSALVDAGLAAPGELGRVRLTGHRELEQPGDRLTVLDDRIPLDLGDQVISFGDLVITVAVVDIVANLARRRRRAQVVIDLRDQPAPSTSIASADQDWGTAPRPVPSSGSQNSARPEVHAPRAVPEPSAPASHSR